MPSASASRSAQQPRHSLSVALAAVTCAVAIAGCGSAGRSSSASAGLGQDARAIQYADCMRSHGVPNFPDPNAEGMSVLPSSINQQSPAFLSAETECAKLQPGGGAPSQLPESRKLQLIAIAGCMRKHGVANLPDPMFHGGTVDLGGGPKFGINTQSPAFKQAAAVCKFPTPRGGAVRTVVPPG
jgi:hypothetical protein